MIAGPVFLLGSLLLAAGAMYLLRRFEPLAALLAAAVTTVCAVVVWKSPLIWPTRIAGRLVWFGQPLIAQDLNLRITTAARPLIVFLLAVAAVTFILVWRTYQGRTFYPFGWPCWPCGSVRC